MASIRLAATALAAALALAASSGALGQAVPGSAAVLEVQRMAPQLASFAGTPSNFASLVTGLTEGRQVTLVSTTPDAVQTVTFTPAGGLSAVEAARALEAARQDLIARGIATPSAEQIGVSLVGGPLPTPLGTTPVAGTLATGSAAALPSASTGASSPGARLTVTTTATTGVPPAPASTAPAPRFTSDSTLPGASTSPATRFTSDSPSIGTSRSPGTGFTSHSPYFGTSDSPIPGATPRVNPATPGAPAGAAAAPGQR